MTQLSQPSPAPLKPLRTEAAAQLNQSSNKLPLISLVTGILSLVLFIVPFLGLILGAISTITGFRSVIKYGPTKMSYIGAILGLCGAAFGLFWVFAIVILGVSIF